MAASGSGVLSHVYVCMCAFLPCGSMISLHMCTATHVHSHAALLFSRAKPAMAVTAHAQLLLQCNVLMPW